MTKKQAMIKALKETLGIVTAAAKKANINPCTHYEWMKKDEKYAADVEEVGEQCLDFAESQLLKLIAGGDTTATIFYLKTKGKGRGYVEKQQIDVTNTEWKAHYGDEE